MLRSGQERIGGGRLAVVVEAALVFVQAASKCERLLARLVRTGERFLARVMGHVASQVIAPGERLFALVALERPLSGVDQLVHLESTPV